MRLAPVTLPRRDRGSVPTLNANVASAVSAVRALAPSQPDVICLPGASSTTDWRIGGPPHWRCRSTMS